MKGDRVRPKNGRHDKRARDKLNFVEPRSGPGCLMCDCLYVKANGKMPCWDDLGESRVLRQLSYQDLLAGKERHLFDHPTLISIRQAFMEGRVPFPEFCDYCAVRQHGGEVRSLRPDSMRILHIESSYLCHLSCPQCIRAVDRRNLESPPYHMPKGALEAFLRQLRTEGVKEIRIVHFEGRGDPLMDPHLGEMIESVHRIYPDTKTMVTTHGSYQYKPWVVTSGLDIFRVSVDGAFPETYAKYRVGGNLNLALQFLRSLQEDRQRLNSPMVVVWKYILFKWNDTDAEIRHAAALAKQLDVIMEFVLTDGPGRSERFRSLPELHRALRLLAPGSTTDATFRSQEVLPREPDDQVRRRIRTMLQLALKLIRANEEHNAIGLITRAVDADCGVSPDDEFGSDRKLIRAYLPLIMSNGRFPETLAGLSQILGEWGDRDNCIRLLRRYVDMDNGLSPTIRLWLALRLRFQVRTRLRMAIAHLSKDSWKMSE